MEMMKRRHGDSLNDNVSPDKVEADVAESHSSTDGNLDNLDTERLFSLNRPS